jgi:hypothetical protein
VSFISECPSPKDEITKYAEIFIEMIACYSVPDLVDNCFWETVIRNSIRSTNREKRSRREETSIEGA